MLKLMLGHQKLVGDSRLLKNSLRFKHSSSEVRSQFLEFFQDHGHKCIASSPVVPLNDPSLVFVNAGMNQFKSVLQNELEPPNPRVVNTQRCIRVGGKHNDLSQVGTDGSHLTLFEMLGSWSFKDYWKDEACSMAWTLLTQHYSLDPNKLYVTYFGGCQKSGLPPDTETRDVWLNLGVDPTHILPFGMKDNFWEMGASGPCGPSTEIHYDYNNRGPDLVNAGSNANIEIWNLVFVQYNRLLNGELEHQQGRHIDTGMGLERLLAVLNNSNSSFDSDLFQPIFEAISSYSKAPAYGGKFGTDSELDTAYRILADHIRMISVCLADQVFPDQNHKLKYVLRRAFSIANNNFSSPPGILKELSNHVIESLGPTFPVLQTRQNIIKLILDYEEENYNKFMDKSVKNYHQLCQDYSEESKRIDTTEATPFLESLRLLDKENVSENLDPSLAYKLYESHGMQDQDIIKLCNIRNIQFDLDEFNRYFASKKEESRVTTSQAQGLKLVLESCVDLAGTDDSSKYSYTRSSAGEYYFPVVDANVLKIVADGNVVKCLNEGEEGIIILDKTSFYSEAGGQVGDTGVITTALSTFKVTNTQPLPGNLVAHIGHVTVGALWAGEAATVSIDAKQRLQAMQNHSATHILNSVLHTLLPLTAQKSSLVKPEYLRFDFSSYNADTDLDFLSELEDGVISIINEERLIKSSHVSNSSLHNIANLVTLPGEVYPEEVTLVDLGNQVEPCCGTHLKNTKDVNSFVIVGFKSASAGVKSVRCLTGDKARVARENGVKVCENILSYQDKLAGNCDEQDKKALESVEKKISTWKKAISEPDFPTILNLELSQVLETYRQKILLSTRSDSKQEAKRQYDLALGEQKGSPFLITLIKVDKGKVNLTNLCSAAKKPALIIVIEGNLIKGKATLEKHLVGDSFNAKLWLTPLAKFVGGKCQPPKGQDATINCNLSSMKIGKLNTEELEAVLAKVKDLASQHIS